MEGNFTAGKTAHINLISDCLFPAKDLITAMPIQDAHKNSQYANG